MDKIYKQVINPRSLDKDNMTVIEVPYGSRILKADSQREEICIWYRFAEHSENNKTKMKVWVIPTGVSFVASENYLGTVMLHNGSLVFHVFLEFV
jgi:hypothetical protein